MIDIKFDNFDHSTNEGKMLLAALAILTTIDHEDINSRKYGGSTHPYDAFDSVLDLANKIYYEDEYKLYLSSVERDNKINDVIKNTP